MPTGHFERTEEHKQNISEALSGKPKPWLLKEKVEVICPCGNSIFLTPGQVRKGHGKFCSRDCYFKFRVPVSGIPKGSKRPPFSTEWRSRISNARKQSGVAKGSNNPNWQGGKTKLQTKIRGLDQYKLWRQEIYKRDNFQCVFCGVNGNGHNLNADHIKALSQIIFEYNIYTVEEAMVCNQIWDVSNGRTLCIKCHRNTPTYGWKTWNSIHKQKEVTI